MLQPVSPTHCLYYNENYVTYHVINRHNRVCVQIQESGDQNVHVKEAPDHSYA